MSGNKEAWINLVGLVFSVSLFIAFSSYLVNGSFFGLRPSMLPLAVVLMTFIALAFFQIRVSWLYERHPFHIPVPFRWVMAVWFSSMLIVVTWAMAWRVIGGVSRDGAFGTIVWYQLAFASVWFFRRFLVIPRDPEHIIVHETRTARDNRQDSREDGLDQRALGLDKRGWDMSKESIQQGLDRKELDRRDAEI